MIIPFPTSNNFYLISFILKLISQQTEEGDKEKANAGESPNTKKEGIKQDKGVVKKEVCVKSEKDHRDAQKAKEIKENEIIRDLKAQLK